MMTDTIPSPLTEAQQMSMLWQAHRIAVRTPVEASCALAHRVILRGASHGCSTAVRAFAEKLRRKHGIVAVPVERHDGGSAA